MGGGRPGGIPLSRARTGSAGAPAPSLVRRLTAGLTVAVGLSSATVVTVTALRDMRAGEADLERSADLSIDSLTRILEDPLWDLDMARISSIAAAAAADPRVVSLTVRETSTGKAYVVGADDPTDVIWRSGAIRHRGRDLGSVSIAFARAPYREQVWQQVWTGLGVSLVALVVGFVSVGFLLRRLLRRPLDDLMQTARAYEHGRYDPPAVVARAHEFEPIHVAMTAMGEQIQRQVGELQATNRELKARNAEMEQFTYTVSHDLKSPLVTISGYLGVVEEDLAGGRTAELGASLERIDAAVAKMTHLLDDLLELSRLGRVANPAARVALGEVVRDALERVTGTIRSRGVTVTVAPDLPEVTGDRVRLVQVVQNLVENAVKYMGAQAAPAIEIGTRPDPAGVVCFVRDNGIGVQPKHAARIFGLFEKLDPTSEGTGVGLALVRRIVEVHGGTVWVESDGATGSTFLFRLPAS